MIATLCCWRKGLEVFVWFRSAPEKQRYFSVLKLCSASGYDNVFLSRLRFTIRSRFLWLWSSNQLILFNISVSNTGGGCKIKMGGVHSCQAHRDAATSEIEGSLEVCDCVWFGFSISNPRSVGEYSRTLTLILSGTLTRSLVLLCHRISPLRRACACIKRSLRAVASKTFQIVGSALGSQWGSLRIWSFLMFLSLQVLRKKRHWAGPLCLVWSPFIFVHNFPQLWVWAPFLHLGKDWREAHASHAWCALKFLFCWVIRYTHA